MNVLKSRQQKKYEKLEDRKIVHIVILARITKQLFSA